MTARCFKRFFGGYIFAFANEKSVWIKTQKNKKLTIKKSDRTYIIAFSSYVYYMLALVPL
jgi:hypothetical protein